jgi:thioredoxin reductase (NADPH)
MPMLALYLLPLLLIWGWFLARSRRREARALAIHADNLAAGLSEPASLHPVIDPISCIGCNSCVAACPEGDVLGLVGGKAQLIAPGECIGHGACAESCPVGAITLVFGTARRGVDLPNVGPDFQTNVPGLWIAGELGGMGLIRNAVEQGRQAVDHISKQTAGRTGGADLHDLIVVGAGPAGISASLAAKAAGLTTLTLEQDTLGGTVSHYPRGKLVMTRPALLPLHGTVQLRETSKEALLGLWTDVVSRHDLPIRFEERVQRIKPAEAQGPSADGFEVVTDLGRYRSRHVLLAIGRRGTPRPLGVPGEDLPKVSYRLDDPAAYSGKSVLVVGGGDSALEAAMALAEQPGTQVMLSYRGAAFQRAKTRNRERIAELAASGRVTLHLGSDVVRIDGATVTLQLSPGGEGRVFDNEAVIICAGGILPTEFLKTMGIQIETKHGAA